jgi:hypothetical protein
MTPDQAPLVPSQRAEPPTISDEWIAERWPDQDADEVRRRFDALMDKLGETPWRGVPRFPEVMQPVLAWAAMLPAERIEVLTAALADVPEHFRDYLYVASKPAFGEQSVKYMSVCGDSGHGMGRQSIAVTPYVKGYNIAPWIAAASPGNVGALLAELERLRAERSNPVGEELASYEKFDGVGPHSETIETRARIGERYLECYESALNDPRLKGYTPADCPSELLLDMLNSWEPAPVDESPQAGEDGHHPLIERLLDAQQDINFAANTRMDQSLCDASALIDEIEPILRAVLAKPQVPDAPTCKKSLQVPEGMEEQVRGLLADYEHEKAMNICGGHGNSQRIRDDFVSKVAALSAQSPSPVSHRERSER